MFFLASKHKPVWDRKWIVANLGVTDRASLKGEMQRTNLLRHYWEFFGPENPRLFVMGAAGAVRRHGEAGGLGTRGGS